MTPVSYVLVSVVIINNEYISKAEIKKNMISNILNTSPKKSIPSENIDISLNRAFYALTG